MGKQSIAIVLGLIFTTQVSVHAQVRDNTWVAPAAVAGELLSPAESDADLIERIEILQKRSPEVPLKYILLGVSLSALVANEIWAKLLLSNYEETLQRLKSYYDQIDAQEINLETHNRAHKIFSDLDRQIRDLDREINIIDHEFRDKVMDEATQQRIETIDARVSQLTKRREIAHKYLNYKTLPHTQVSLIRIDQLGKMLKSSKNPFEVSLGHQLDKIFTGPSEIMSFTQSEVSKSSTKPNIEELNKALTTLQNEIKSYEKSITQFKNMRLTGRAAGILVAASALYFIFEEMWSNDATYGGQGVFGRKLGEASREEINDLIKKIKESGLTYPEMGHAISSIAGKL